MLRLHCARHTYATRALHAGKSLRWVSQQLGHASPELTLSSYSHVMPEEESDVSFAEFGGSKRLYPAPGEDGPRSDTSGTYLSDQDHWKSWSARPGSNRRPSAWEADPSVSNDG